MMASTLLLALALQGGEPAPRPAPPPPAAVRINGEMVSCAIEFDTELTDLKPIASTLELGERLYLVLSAAPVASAVAMRGTSVEIGAIRDDPHLALMLACGAAGRNYRAQVTPGVYQVHVSLMPN